MHNHKLRLARHGWEGKPCHTHTESSWHMATWLARCLMPQGRGCFLFGRQPSWSAQRRSSSQLVGCLDSQSNGIFCVLLDFPCPQITFRKRRCFCMFVGLHLFLKEHNCCILLCFFSDLESFIGPLQSTMPMKFTGSIASVSCRLDVGYRSAKDLSLKSLWLASFGGPRSFEIEIRLYVYAT